MDQLTSSRTRPLRSDLRDRLMGETDHGVRPLYCCFHASARSASPLLFTDERFMYMSSHRKFSAPLLPWFVSSRALCAPWIRFAFSRFTACFRPQTRQPTSHREVGFPSTGLHRTAPDQTLNLGTQAHSALLVRGQLLGREQRTTTFRSLIIPSHSGSETAPTTLQVLTIFTCTQNFALSSNGVLHACIRSSSYASMSIPRIRSWNFDHVCVQWPGGITWVVGTEADPMSDRMRQN